METQYESLKKRIVWGVIKESISNLKKNRDLSLATNDDYVIGYLVKNIYEKFDLCRKRRK